LVSVVIACFNSERYVGEAIDSVLSQDYRKLEVLVVDDRSTDRSACVAHARANADARVRVVRLPRNVGRAAALNVGIREARGELICFLDADDWMSPGRLTVQVDFLRQHRDVVMAYGDFERQRQDGRIVAVAAIDFEGEARAALAEACRAPGPPHLFPHKQIDRREEARFIPSCSALIRGEVFASLRFDEALRNCEDQDLWLQIIGRGFRIARLPAITYRYREHAAQKSRNGRDMLLACEHVHSKLDSGRYMD
jgi:glycosyltransferase involved in cell wall biosynthesis